MTRKIVLDCNIFTDEDQPMTIIFWHDGSDYFFSFTEGRPDADTQLTLQATLIPRSYYLASAEGLAVFKPSPEYETHHKNFHGLLIAQTDFKFLGSAAADTFRQEALIGEALGGHPHKNVCQYPGAEVSDGHLVGQVWERHGKSLWHAVNDGESFNASTIIDGVRQGLNHIHSLGYVHNDIKPTNVVLAADGRPVIIDFDVSHPIGGLVGNKLGNEPWYSEALHAQPEHDIRALYILKLWLEHGTTEGYTGFPDDYQLNIPAQLEF